MRALWSSVGLALLCGATAMAAEDRAISAPAASQGERPKKKPNKPARASLEEAPAARSFARQHHPELLLILDHLEKNRTNEYQHAINDLHKTASRLAQWKARDVARYELELKAWKLRSRIQLLAAKLQIDPDNEKLRGTLRQTLLEQADLEIAACEAERQRHANRLEQADEQLRRLRATRETRIDRKIETLTRPKKK